MLAVFDLVLVSQIAIIFFAYWFFFFHVWDESRWRQDIPRVMVLPQFHVKQSLQIVLNFWQIFNAYSALGLILPRADNGCEIKKRHVIIYNFHISHITTFSPGSFIDLLWYEIRNIFTLALELMPDYIVDNKYRNVFGILVFSEDRKINFYENVTRRSSPSRANV